MRIARDGLLVVAKRRVEKVDLFAALWMSGIDDELGQIEHADVAVFFRTVVILRRQKELVSGMLSVNDRADRNRRDELVLIGKIGGLVNGATAEYSARHFQRLFLRHQLCKQRAAICCHFECVFHQESSSFWPSASCGTGIEIVVMLAARPPM